MSTNPNLVNHHRKAIMVSKLAPNYGWKEDYFLVASVIAVAIESNKQQDVASSYLPLRCLGYNRLKTEDEVAVKTHMFDSISKVFELDQIDINLESHGMSKSLRQN